jgi:hypothetical protein
VNFASETVPGLATPANEAMLPAPQPAVKWLQSAWEARQASEVNTSFPALLSLLLDHATRSLLHGTNACVRPLAVVARLLLRADGHPGRLDGLLSSLHELPSFGALPACDASVQAQWAAEATVALDGWLSAEREAAIGARMDEVHRCMLESLTGHDTDLDALARDVAVPFALSALTAEEPLHAATLAAARRGLVWFVAVDAPAHADSVGRGHVCGHAWLPASCLLALATNVPAPPSPPAQALVRVGKALADVAALAQGPCPTRLTAAVLEAAFTLHLTTHASLTPRTLFAAAGDSAFFDADLLAGPTMRFLTEHASISETTPGELTARLLSHDSPSTAAIFTYTNSPTYSEVLILLPRPSAARELLVVHCPVYGAERALLSSSARVEEMVQAWRTTQRVYNDPTLGPAGNALHAQLAHSRITPHFVLFTGCQSVCPSSIALASTEALLDLPSMRRWQPSTADAFDLLLWLTDLCVPRGTL